MARQMEHMAALQAHQTSLQAHQMRHEGPATPPVTPPHFAEAATATAAAAAAAAATVELPPDVAATPARLNVLEQRFTEFAALTTPPPPSPPPVPAAPAASPMEVDALRERVARLENIKPPSPPLPPPPPPPAAAVNEATATTVMATEAGTEAATASAAAASTDVEQLRDLEARVGGWMAEVETRMTQIEETSGSGGGGNGSGGGGGATSAELTALQERVDEIEEAQQASAGVVAEAVAGVVAAVAGGAESQRHVHGLVNGRVTELEDRQEAAAVAAVANAEAIAAESLKLAAEVARVTERMHTLETDAAAAQSDIDPETPAKLRTVAARVLETEQQLQEMRENSATATAAGDEAVAAAAAASVASLSTAETMAELRRRLCQVGWCTMKPSLC